MNAPLPNNEAARLAALREYQILNTPPEAAFDDLTQLAAQICQTSIALISLIDECCQWFKSKFGLAVTETPRDIAFCSYAILQPDILVVPNALEDDRFATNPLVTGEPYIRFYAGVPLNSPQGYSLGTLCVIDSQPRQLQPEQLQALRVLARQVVAQLELRREVASRPVREELEHRVAQRTAELARINQDLRQEIAERQRMEAALRESEERYRLLVELSPNGIFIQQDGCFVFANQAAIDLYGAANLEDLVGQSVLSFVHPDEQALIQDRIHRLVVEQQPAPTLEQKLVRRDGTMISVEMAAIPFFYRGQAAAQVLIRDISDRKQAEAELQRQIQRSQLFADVMQKIRQSLDLDEILQTTVNEVQNILQADRVLVFRLWPNGVGRVITEAVLPQWPPILGSRITDDCFGPEYLELYKAGRIYTIADVDNSTAPKCLVGFLQQFRIKSKLVMPILSKEKLWGLLIAHHCAHPRQWSEFEIELLQQLAVQIGIALTQAQLLDQEVRQSQELLRSNLELQQFAAIASHDLQEPLRKILSFSNRLKSTCGDALTEQGQDYLERMGNAAERMKTLIDDLLTLSRISTRIQPFVPLSLAQIVQEVLSDVEILVQQTQAQVQVETLPTIEADSLQMRQLFQNLISNALKFHRPDLAPQVKIYSQPLLTSDSFPMNSNRAVEWCQVLIEDNGIGFDEKYLDRIFNVFQRLHNRSEYEGTGIGLAICRKIVEQHGGSITARSSLGQGATFIITLPIHQQKGEQHL